MCGGERGGLEIYTDACLTVQHTALERRKEFEGDKGRKKKGGGAIAWFVNN